MITMSGVNSMFEAEFGSKCLSAVERPIHEDAQNSPESGVLTTGNGFDPEKTDKSDDLERI